MLRDVKPVYPVDDLIRHSTDVTSFIHATKYVVYLKLMIHMKLEPPNVVYKNKQNTSWQVNKQIDKKD